VSLFVLQLKAVVVETADRHPHLVFIATKLVEVGDELLFDYNDRESRLPFLKQCPVCSSDMSGPPQEVAPTTTGRKRPASDDEIATLAKKARLTEDDGDRLYEAVVSHFSTTADVTRSALEQWQPTLSEDNIRFILHRRNVQAITVRLTPISFVTCCVYSSLLLKVEQL